MWLILVWSIWVTKRCETRAGELSLSLARSSYFSERELTVSLKFGQLLFYFEWHVVGLLKRSAKCNNLYLFYICKSSSLLNWGYSRPHTIHLGFILLSFVLYPTTTITTPCQYCTGRSISGHRTVENTSIDRFFFFKAISGDVDLQLTSLERDTPKEKTAWGLCQHYQRGLSN